MEVKNTYPIIYSMVVAIDKVKYKNTFCKIEVECLAFSIDDDPIFQPSKASCEEPYFIMGTSFWEKSFGKKQANRIKKLCDKAIKEHIKKERI